MKQSRELDRKKLLGDPIMITTLILLVTALTVFILYPLAILLIDSIYGTNGISLNTFVRIMHMPNFRRAICSRYIVNIYWFIIFICRSLCKNWKSIKRVIWFSINAAYSVASICIIIINDNVIW